MRLVALIGVLGLVLAACSPVSSETTTTTSTAPTSTTTTTQPPPRLTIPPSFDIPEDAWGDWARGVCESPGDVNHLMTVADDLAAWAGDGPSNPETTLAVAQALWERARALCPGAYTEELVAAGPPTEFQYPECSPMSPSALPWAEDTGEADEVVVTDGVVESLWLGPAYVGDHRESVSVAVGRGEAYQRVIGAGEHAGSIIGEDAWVLGHEDTDASSSELAWSVGDRWCDAVVVRIEPTPDELPGDFAGYVEAMIYVPFVPELNEAEETLFAAIEGIPGAVSLGGEPSHGSPTASMEFALGGHEFWVVMAPPGIEIIGRDLGELTDEVTMSGIDILIYRSDSELIALFDTPSYAVRLSGNLDVPQSALLDAAIALTTAVERVIGE